MLNAAYLKFMHKSNYYLDNNYSATKCLLKQK